MLTDKQAIEWLWEFGHFRNPASVNAMAVADEHDLSLLTTEDEEVKEAIRSLQMLDYSAEILSQKYHGRPIQFDGDIGPATRELMTLDRCGIPDYGNDYGAQGSGSWPVPGCDPTRPNRASEHSTRVYIDSSRASSHQKAILLEATRLVEQCEAEIGQSVRHIIDGPDKDAEHFVAFEGMFGGKIGFAYYPQAGTSATSPITGILYMANQRYMPVRATGGYVMLPADTPSFPI